MDIHAHRGGASLAPENTLAAFERAAGLGVQWIHLDVQTCGTGEPVVILDPDLGRLAGLPEARVRDLPLPDLQAVDVGSHFSAEHAGASVPTLLEVVEGLRGRVRFHVEVKEYGPRGDGTAARTAALLRRMLPWDEVLVTSYNPFALRRVGSVAKGLPRGLVHPPEGGVDGPRKALRDAMFGEPWSARWLGVRALLPKERSVTPARVRSAQRRGWAVIPWVVDDPLRMKQLFGMGVDGLVTSRPDVALGILDPR